MKKKTIFIWIIILLALTAVGFVIKRQIEIDKCLDNGGKWNYETGQCEYN
jgi:uncharacterized membrane-anchored protein